MKNQTVNRPIQRISQIYEKVCTPEGEGFAGFTIYHDGDLFTNHIEFFVKDTHDQVTRQVKAAYADLCKTCRAGQPKDE